MPLDVLVVDDEELIRKVIVGILKKGNYVFAEAGSAAEARELVKGFSFDLALVDVMMPNESGISLVRSLLADHPSMAVVMVTGVADPTVAEVVSRMGVYGYVLKPIVKNQLIITVENALIRGKLERANRNYITQLERLVADRVAALDRTVSRLESVELALRESEGGIGTLLDVASDPTFVADREGRITQMNFAARELLGLEADQGASAGAIAAVDPGAWQALLEKLRVMGKLSNLPLALRREGGSVLEVQISAVARYRAGAPEGYVIVARDVTGLRQIQSQVARAGELRSLDYVGPSVVEELSKCTQYAGFNTAFLERSFADLRKVITLFSRLVEGTSTGETRDALIRALLEELREVDLPSLVAEVPAALEQTLQALERIKKISAALRDFSGTTTTTLEPVDLNSALESTLTAAKNRWRFVASVELDLDPSRPLALGQRRLLCHAFLWLLRHCTSAVAQLVNRRLGEQRVITVTSRALEDRVEVRFGYEGSSLSGEVAASLVDPAAPSGAGVVVPSDLEEARQVVEGYEGDLSVELVEGLRTTFVVTLPRATSTPRTPSE